VENQIISNNLKYIIQHYSKKIKNKNKKIKKLLVKDQIISNNLKYNLMR